MIQEFRKCYEILCKRYPLEVRGFLKQQNQRTFARSGQDMAANLIGLLSYQDKNGTILQAFKTSSFTGLPAHPSERLHWITCADEERENCCPTKTVVMPYKTLPEVQQYDDIMRLVYQDHCFTKLQGP